MAIDEIRAAHAAWEHDSKLAAVEPPLEAMEYVGELLAEVQRLEWGIDRIAKTSVGRCHVCPVGDECRVVIVDRLGLTLLDPEKCQARLRQWAEEVEDGD